MTNKTVHLVIKRQNDANSPSYTEEFKVPYRPGMNVVAALMEIQKNPVTVDGKVTTPVVWEAVCLEEVCGACSMLINGKPRQSCSALIDQLEQPIKLAPLTSFPVERDLMVNRERLFDALKKVKAWVEVDGSFDLGPGPRMPEKQRQWAYVLSECMTCGCCFEACPNATINSDFVGPHALSQVRLFNAQPNGKMNKEERLDAIMQKGGIATCGNSQNCWRACPKGIPLHTSIADLNRQLIVHNVKQIFGSSDAKSYLK